MNKLLKLMESQDFDNLFLDPLMVKKYINDFINGDIKVLNFTGDQYNGTVRFTSFIYHYLNTFIIIPSENLLRVKEIKDTYYFKQTEGWNNTAMKYIKDYFRPTKNTKLEPLKNKQL